MKPLIVGEQPSKNGDPEKPCEGRIGARLAECAGLTYARYVEAFERTNLMHVRAEYTPEYLGKGDAFNVREASKHARRLTETNQGRVMLILGKRAASAFGLTNVLYFDRCPMGDGIIAYVVPHPSGVNRWWNEPANEIVMVQFMHSFVRKYIELDR